MGVRDWAPQPDATSAALRVPDIILGAFHRSCDTSIWQPMQYPLDLGVRSIKVLMGLVSGRLRISASLT